MTSQPFPKPARRRFHAGIGALLAACALLCSQTALADPAVAAQYLQISKSNYQVLKIYYQQGKLLANSGQADAARSNFLSTQVQAAQLTQSLLRLQQENVDTLQRGLCRDCDKQQLAVNENKIASQQAQLLQLDVSLLVQMPTSQAQISRVDFDIAVLDIDLLRLEQDMAAAQ